MEGKRKKEKKNERMKEKMRWKKKKIIKKRKEKSEGVGLREKNSDVPMANIHFA